VAKKLGVTAASGMRAGSPAPSSVAGKVRKLVVAANARALRA
jgi:hypothetical protein